MERASLAADLIDWRTVCEKTAIKIRMKGGETLPSF
jgi:hypothetical protein